MTLPHYPRNRGKITYRPDIDGLRAVAVLAVVGFHAFPRRLPSGFVGVDIFFVISGFLISSIIIKETEAGVFRYSNFYFRRIRRIFPALILVLLATVTLGWTILLSGEYKLLLHQVIAGSFFYSSLELMRRYFAILG
jgi:peptidoglycan/LPS O-acetylase OafA/YrhL